jgi:hypothetical protein
MRDALAAGAERFERPRQIVRYTFEMFARRGVLEHKGPAPPYDQHCVIPIEAVADGDEQVVAARAPAPQSAEPVELASLASFPSVVSVIASAPITTSRELPGVRELLVTANAPIPESTTLRRLTGLQSMFSTVGFAARLNLDDLPAAQMRELAVNRWKLTSYQALARMTNLIRLTADLFREPLDPIAGMPSLEFLVVRGPAKGWAKLRECKGLRSAAFSDVQMANLKRWNTWRELEELSLTGRGLKSLAGLEACSRLQYLTLCNMQMSNLGPLTELPCLSHLTLRLPKSDIDPGSISRARSLRRLVIDANFEGTDLIQLESLGFVARLEFLEELVLDGVAIGDGNLMPLAGLPNLRKVKLGQDIGADVEKLRQACPHLEVLYTPPPERDRSLEVRVGEVTIHRPGDGIDQWWIFESYAERLKTSTNYAAEKLIQSAVKKHDARLGSRLEWDTEAGAVGIYAADEEDIRAVARVINQLLASH